MFLRINRGKKGSKDLINIYKIRDIVFEKYRKIRDIVFEKCRTMLSKPIMESLIPYTLPASH